MMSPSTNFVGSRWPLTENRFNSIAKELGVSTASLWAVVFAETEPPFAGFEVTGRPQMLYERHKFAKFTGHKHDDRHPDLSNGTPGGYTRNEYDRLARAIALDRSAALRSSSWGIMQVLGDNFAEVGFRDVEEMIAAMLESEDRQMEIGAEYIRARKLASALRVEDWRAFAVVYNGPKSPQKYVNRLRDAYSRISRLRMDFRIRSAQAFLMYLGFNPGDLDGLLGKKTLGAINRYQTARSLPLTATLDDATNDHLRAEFEELKPASYRWNRLDRIVGSLDKRTRRRYFGASASPLSSIGRSG